MPKAIKYCILLGIILTALLSCGGAGDAFDSALWYMNPVGKEISNTSIYFSDGKYYLTQNNTGRILVQKMDDPADINLQKMVIAAEMQKDYGLQHLWHPQLYRYGGTWYIYVTADDGNTDNHKMYVLQNANEDPTTGSFIMASRLVTDTGDNWAMHGHVFEHKGQLYIIWSGWESRRAYVETQCIYIAKMKDPLTIDGERVMISRPEYEWERQWVQRDGQSSIRYPVFVNEHPSFLCCDKTDKAYIYYSASGGWTAFSCIGELSADKDADFLNPSSWVKAPTPAFSENRDDDIYGPSVPFFFPSPDGARWYLCYSATKEATIGSIRTPFIQPITFSESGHPELGRPASRETKFRRVTALP